jgi:hypothetical protein
MLAQNDSPADIVSANVFPFIKSHVHRLKRCEALASFKPTFEAIGNQEDVRRHDVRGGVLCT